MKVTCLGCCHGAYNRLELLGGDILIVTGDLTRRDMCEEYLNFLHWIKKQDYKKKIFIAGNHDNILKYETSFIDPMRSRLHQPLKHQIEDFIKGNIEYLCNSGTEFEGLKIWGSPESLWFDQINPRCSSFTGSEEELRSKYELIPHDTDILITHTPPYSILDQNEEGHNCGSRALLDTLDRVKPKYSIFSHIHERGGDTMLYKHMMDKKSYTTCINSSIMDENYRPIHKPINFEI